LLRPSERLDKRPARNRSGRRSCVSRGRRRAVAAAIAASAATDEDTVRAYAKAFEDAGCDELTFFPTSTDPQQVDLLADAIGL
jgi:hypothetical protein